MTALGIALLVIGAIMVLAEAHVPSLGVLGGPGVVGLTVGAVLAVAGLGGGAALAAIVALVVFCTGLGAVWLSLRKGMAVRHRRIRTGSEGMLGHIGVVRSWDQRGGKVLVDGALWHARAQVQTDNGHEPHELHAGDSVVVEHVSGLTITVRPAEEWELLP